MPQVLGSYGVGGGATGVNVANTRTNPSPGDLRLFVLSVASTTTITAPTGWGKLTDVVVGSGRLCVAYRVFQSGDPSVTFNFNQSSQLVTELFNLGSDVDLANIVVVTNGGATSTAIVASSVVPAALNSLLLTFHAVSVASGATTTTMTAPAGMTKLDYIPGTASVAHVQLSASLALNSTAATGTKQATSSSSGNWRTASIVVPPIPTDADDLMLAGA